MFRYGTVKAASTTKASYEKHHLGAEVTQLTTLAMYNAVVRSHVASEWMEP